MIRPRAGQSQYLPYNTRHKVCLGRNASVLRLLRALAGRSLRLPHGAAAPIKGPVGKRNSFKLEYPASAIQTLFTSERGQP